MLSKEEIEYIQTHIANNPVELMLKGNSKKLVAQIQARQKARYKLPLWYANAEAVFPVALSVEQSSSEATAQYKASLVSGTLVDCTGGMGIDTIAFSNICKSVFYIERNQELAQVFEHNLGVFAIQNVRCFNEDYRQFLEKSSQSFDWLYIDPARRDAQQQRVFKLVDCGPNVPENLDFLLTKTQNILIKTSPLLDIKSAIEELQNKVRRVHVVSVENDCKELLFEVSPLVCDDVEIVAVNFRKTDIQRFTFNLFSESTAKVTFAEPQKYLYEPNASVLKAGAFKSIAEAFLLTKIAPNTHLYGSNLRSDHFPGRVFEVLDIIKVDAKALAKYVPERKANVTIRNFPLSVDKLRKQLRLKEGGHVYLFAVTMYNNEKRLIVCR